MVSYQRSLEEEEKSKRIAQKANRFKVNIPGGFVNRRKTQILGFKLMQVLQMEGEEFLQNFDSTKNSARRGPNLVSKEVKQNIDGQRSLS